MDTQRCLATTNSYRRTVSANEPDTLGMTNVIHIYHPDTLQEKTRRAVPPMTRQAEMNDQMTEPESRINPEGAGTREVHT